MDDPRAIELPVPGESAERPVPPPVVAAPVVLPSYDAIPELSDGHVALRRWAQRDVPVLVAATRDRDMRRFRMLPGPHSDETARGFVAACRGFWERDHHALWLAVTDAGGGEVVGGVHLLAVSPEVARGQLGCWTLPSHQGRGIATAAAGLLADWAFDGLRLARLQVETHVTNLASRRVAEKLGFTLEAVLRSHRPLDGRRSDCLLYGRLATDPGPAVADDRQLTDRDLGSGPTGRARANDPQVVRLLAGARSDRPAATPTLPERQPTLHDGALTLRPWRDDAGDLRGCMEGCSDPETLRWLPMLPCPYTEHDARSFLTRAVAGWDEESDGHFAVVDAAGRHVGGARLRPVGDPAVAEIGYRVVPGARRRGVATAVTRTLTRWALHDLGFARVQIRAERLNHASVGVALKAGFTQEGVLRSHEVDRGGVRRDDVLFSVLADEPR